MWNGAVVLLMLRLNLFLFVDCLISVWHDYPPGPPEVPHRLPLQPTLYQISLKSLAPQRLRGERISPFLTDISNLEHIICYIYLICNWIKLKNGDLCVSILHPPVDDPQSGELPCERWDILCLSVYVYIYKYWFLIDNSGGIPLRTSAQFSCQW